MIKRMYTNLFFKLFSALGQQNDFFANQRDKKKDYNWKELFFVVHDDYCTS